MNPGLIVPIVALLAVFGMPVAIVYITRIFRLKERELALEAGADQDDRTRQLEARIARLELAVGALDRDVRRALPPAAGESAPQLPPASTD